MLTVIVVLDHEILLKDQVKMVAETWKDVVPEIVIPTDQRTMELRGREVDHAIIVEEVDHVTEKIVALMIRKEVAQGK